jgi:hypothetical protein
MTLAEQSNALSLFSKKARIRYYLEDGEARTVRAMVWRNWAIHPSSRWRINYEYALTHIPTGYCAATHSSRGALAVLAVRLDTLGDWSSSKLDELPIERGTEVLRQWEREVENIEDSP